MKRFSLIIAALALVLGFSQCKKEEPLEPINGEKIHITLKVASNTRHSITFGATGHVDYENGDKIYVGDGTKYIGTLENTSGTFGGDVDIPSGDKLYFYFVGGAPITPVELSAGTTSYTVDISNQSGKLPVLSMGEADYLSTKTEYNCALKNKCALVKLSLSNAISTVQLGNRYTTATINFASPGITPSGEANGTVTFYSKGGTEKWAILLPQEADATANNVTIAGTGFTVSVPKIENNGYVTDIPQINNSSVCTEINLAEVTSDVVAQDGNVLINTLVESHKISIADGATVTLNGASINATGTWTTGNYAGITCLGNATIILSGTNTVKGFYENYPGIFVPESYTLTIQGTGSLTASSNGYGAGIGGGYRIPCGNIVINGGSSIEATGGNYAAGIGGVGWGCGDITISGGNITANGGVSAAGIGTGNGDACGKITISGGSITANGGDRGAGIGTGGDGTCGNITINNTVTSVTATGGAYAAGIGTGYAEEGNNSCGAISINGGTVTATGGLNAAGIGTGYSFSDITNSCASITIYNTVTSVTATKGSSAPNSIGAGERGTCGTVTIGGVTGAITESPYTYPAPVAPSGAIDGLFSVSSTKQVWFSQGNLQATTTDHWSSWTFSFMEHQYSTVETTGSYCTSDYGNRDVVSLFGWATSGYNHGATCYQPYSTNPNNGNYYAYGDASYNLYDQTGQADWGYNAISNGGNTVNSGWRTLTTEEWQYLFANHTKGWSTVNGVNGYVIRPDGVSTAIAASYTASDWATEEAAGSVFLPAAGYRNSYVGTDVYDKGSIGRYWSSSIDGSSNAYNLFFSSSLLGPNYSMNRKSGESVRLVKDAN